MIYTREQVWEHRQKWIDVLVNPDTKKWMGMLANPAKPDHRCCLGHACAALDIGVVVSSPEYSARLFFGNEVSNSWSYLPEYVSHDMLGLYSQQGNFELDGNRAPVSILAYKPQYSLADYNDNSHITPQEIGAYLQTVIEGGPGTPFRSLSDFPETL